VVERTFAWLGFQRRLARDHERNPRVSVEVLLEQAWPILRLVR
jgi:transposase